jgi:4'-phosphopantetheinyl transferase
LNALADDEAHVWIAGPAVVEHVESDGGLDLLGAEERARASRFAFERDRRAYVVAHAVLRNALAGYLDADPAALRFAAGTHGRPELEGAGGRPPLRFNLSHTRGLAACVVTRAMDCGADVEHLGPGADYAGLAPTVLSPAELEAWARLAASERERRFIELWTLKEAYMKGRGLGLSLRPAEVGFSRPAEHPVASFGPGVGDDPGQWLFRSRWITPAHCGAIALRANGRPAAIRTFWLAPGSGSGGGGRGWAVPSSMGSAWPGAGSTTAVFE